MKESDHALIFYIKLIGSRVQLSARKIRLKTGFSWLEIENFKLKSLILAQIERWRHA
jgi:hypothetical protein